MAQDIAKIFMNGSSQAVRLPKDYRFDGQEVFIRKNYRGEVVLSRKPRTWVEFFDKYNDESQDSNLFENFMQDRDTSLLDEKDLF